MSRYLSSAAVIVSLAFPVAASAQHSNSGGAPAVGTAMPAGGGGSSSGSSGGGSSANGDGTGSFPALPSPSGRRAGNNPAVGTAVARGSAPGSGGTIVITEGSGFYPWGVGGIIGGLYGGEYDGYYGAYDPWYGWFPAFAPIASDEGGGPDNTGGLRLKVKPADASVYVDSFFVGAVDDFDGAFQKLKLERGPHRIEIRSPQHVPVTFDVMIQEDFTITYRGELSKQ